LVPNSLGVSNFLSKPILMQEFIDPQTLKEVTVEITDMFSRTVKYDDCVMVFNVYSIYDN
jgi:hypothetical protein